MTPLEVYRGEDEDDDEFDEPDDVEGGGSYTGLDDEDYDELDDTEPARST